MTWAPVFNLVGPTGPFGPNGVTGGVLTPKNIFIPSDPYVFNDSVISTVNANTYQCVVSTYNDSTDPALDKSGSWFLLVSRGATGLTGSAGPTILGYTGPIGPVGSLTYGLRTFDGNPTNLRNCDNVIDLTTGLMWKNSPYNLNISDNFVNGGYGNTGDYTATYVSTSAASTVSTSWTYSFTAGQYLNNGLDEQLNGLSIRIGGTFGLLLNGNLLLDNTDVTTLGWRTNTSATLFTAPVSNFGPTGYLSSGSHTLSFNNYINDSGTPGVPDIVFNTTVSNSYFMDVVTDMSNSLEGNIVDFFTTPVTVPARSVFIYSFIVDATGPNNLAALVGAGPSPPTVPTVQFGLGINTILSSGISVTSCVLNGDELVGVWDLIVPTNEYATVLSAPSVVSFRPGPQRVIVTFNTPLTTLPDFVINTAISL